MSRKTYRILYMLSIFSFGLAIVFFCLNYTSEQVTKQNLKHHIYKGMRYKDNTHYVELETTPSTKKPPEPPITNDRKRYIESKFKNLTPHGQPRVVDGVEDILSMTPPTFDPLYKNPCWHHDSITLHCLPYFHIIGVCKSGTTDLFMKLLRHPQILPSTGINGKETHWWSWRRFRYDIFTNDGRYMNYSQYVSKFDAAAQNILHANYSQNSTLPYKSHYITGEGSPTTFWDLSGWNKIPQNKGSSSPIFTTPHCVHHLQPQQKLILMLRNPTDRLYSDYMFLYNPANKSADDFHQRVVSEIAKFRNCEKQRGRKACLLDRDMHLHAKVRLLVNFYADYLQEWIELFPPKQWLIMRTESYSKDVAAHLKKVFHFLGIDLPDDKIISDIAGKSRSFVRSTKDRTLGDMRPDTRQLLNNFYAPHNKQLANILGDDRYLWLDNQEQSI